MRRLRCPVALTLVLVFARAARADDDDRHRRWYGWQPLLIDSACAAVFASLPAWSNGELSTAAGVLDFFVFSFASPMLHAAHGDSNGGISVVLHLTLPASGALVGMGLGAAHHDTCDPSQNLLCGLDGIASLGDRLATGAWVGTLAGAGLAAIVEAVALAWEPASPSSATAFWTITPLALPAGGGLGVAGAF
jgi:hypothetical protein